MRDSNAAQLWNAFLPTESKDSALTAHRGGAARELLSAVRSRLGEGSRTRDCLRADTLLQELCALHQAAACFVGSL